MIQVYRIPVPKEKLLALSVDERALLLLLGYVANQVQMLQKILVFATKLDPAEEVQAHSSAVQTQMLVRLAAAAAFEAWRVIDTRYLSNRLQVDYRDLIDADGQAALKELKQLFGQSPLLSKIRNNFGFHYPDTDATEAAFQAAVADPGFDDMWRLYFSHHGFNSLFVMSDIVFAHGIAAEAGVADLPALQEQLMAELRKASTNVVQFAQAFFIAVWRRHFGDAIDAQDIVNIEGAPKFDEVALPFFVDMEIPAAAAG
jgi:hypothetical protein